MVPTLTRLNMLLKTYNCQGMYGRRQTVRAIATALSGGCIHTPTTGTSVPTPDIDSQSMRRSLLICRKYPTYSDVVSTDAFSAIANPVRRQILASLRDGPRAVNDLAGMFELSRPAVSEHLQVLRHAGLVREEPRGQHRFYHLEPLPLVDVEDWLHPFERYWRARMRDLQKVLDHQGKESS